jgi:hypothetical protein
MARAVVAVVEKEAAGNKGLQPKTFRDVVRKRVREGAKVGAAVREKGPGNSRGIAESC